MQDLMPTYEYRCPSGHVTELVQSIHDPLPADVACEKATGAFDAATPAALTIITLCDQRAARVFSAPAAIHFHGRGFYATDVKGSQERKRRPNAGDDLHRSHQADTAAIARSL